MIKQKQHGTIIRKGDGKNIQNRCPLLLINNTKKMWLMSYITAF
jgi:hypothetical protein